MIVNKDKIAGMLTQDLVMAAMIYSVRITPDGSTSMDDQWQIPYYAGITLAQCIMDTGTDLYQELKKVMTNITRDVGEGHMDYIMAWTEQYDCDIYTCVRLTINGQSKWKWASDIIKKFRKEHYEQDILETIT